MVVRLRVRCDHVRWVILLERLQRAGIILQHHAAADDVIRGGYVLAVQEGAVEVYFIAAATGEVDGASHQYEAIPFEAAVDIQIAVNHQNAGAGYVSSQVAVSRKIGDLWRHRTRIRRIEIGINRAIARGGN